MVRDDAGRDDLDGADRLVPLKATGVMCRLANSKSGRQANVEARCTSSPRSTKNRIQLREIGERPSATKRIFMK